MATLKLGILVSGRGTNLQAILDAVKEGSLDHVTWVAMTDEGPVISNLTLDGMLADDFSTDVTQRVYEVARRSKPVGAASLLTEKELVERLPVKVTMSNDTDVEMKPGRDHWLDEECRRQRSTCTYEWMGSEDPLFILYTSGSTV